MLRPGRELRLDVHAKKAQVQKAIAQNKQKAPRVLVNLERLYSEPAYQPARQAGSVELKPSAGSGRCIMTSAAVAPTEVLLVSEPLAFLTAPLGSELRPADLLEVLKGKQLSPGDSFRLGLLHDGTKASSKQTASLEQLVEAEQHVAREAAKREAAKKGFGAAASAAREEPAGTRGPQWMDAVVRYNSYGQLHTDLAAATCRGEPQTAFIGLFPEYAMLNHSCAPNTVETLVGRRLIVRAARAIPKHGEVTVSYLDKLTYAPLQERRKALQGAYGFKCQCYRCQTEEAQAPEVQAKLQAVYEHTSDALWQERARAVLNSRSDEGVRALQQELQQLTDDLEACFKEHSVAADVQPWLRASVYAAYERLAVCQDMGHESEPEQPAKLAAYQALVTPGSESHLFLALERMMRAGEKDKVSEDTETATKECIAAHQLRYGLVSEQTLTRLMEARRKVDSYMGRYNLQEPAPASSLASAVPTS